MSRRAAAYPKRTDARKSVASPSTISVTAMYMGLRTYRYTPLTTSWRGGSMGAGVPLPRIANSQPQRKYSAAPQANSRIPAAAIQPPSALSAPRSSHLGTRITTVPGTTMVNRSVFSSGTRTTLRAPRRPANGGANVPRGRERTRRSRREAHRRAPATDRCGARRARASGALAGTCAPAPLPSRTAPGRRDRRAR